MSNELKERIKYVFRLDRAVFLTQDQVMMMVGVLIASAVVFSFIIGFVFGFILGARLN